MADKLIANDNIPRPVAFLLPYGKDTEYYLQEVVTDTMETEVIELAAFLQWKAEEIEREGAGGKGPEIITDLKGIDRLMKKTNMVVAFCGEGVDKKFCVDKKFRVGKKFRVFRVGKKFCVGKKFRVSKKSFVWKHNFYGLFLQQMQSVDLISYIIAYTNLKLPIKFTQWLCLKSLSPSLDDPQCPGDAYFAMDDARKVFARSRLDIPYQLFVVQCDSVAEISKYEVSFPPLPLQFLVFT